MNAPKNKKNTKAIVIAMAVLAILIGATAWLAVWAYWGTGSLGSPSPVVPQISSTVTPPVAPTGVEKEISTMDVTGKWTTKVNETTFTVDVVNSAVTIKMSKNGSSMLYWYGTFPSTATIGESITSTKLDINKAVLSGADSKVFVVKQGTLSFDVSAMGQTKTVEVTHA
jgi:hypothetical protein